MSLRDFVAESNRIEGILREPTETELAAHRIFLRRPKPLVAYVEQFVNDVAGKPLRDKLGMDVRVGGHVPPRGGPEIRKALEELLWMDDGLASPFEIHIRYETLHPFMDGNGRSGRVLWAWQMQRDGFDPFALPFLHRFYYQALDATRAPDEAGLI